MAADTNPDVPEPAEPTPDERRILQLEVEFGAAERLTFFSDAVVAIAITLLALELPVPGPGDSRHMLHEMYDHVDEYLAFLISFTVIALHWTAHHRLFRYLRRLGGRLLAVDMLWLLMMVSTPFTTRVLSGDGGFVVRFGLYAAVQAVANLCFLLMTFSIDRHRLTRPGTPREVLTRSYQRSGALGTAFALSIPVALVGEWAYAAWAVGPLVINLARRLYRRYRPTQPPPT